MIEPLYSAMTVETPAVVNVIAQENAAVVRVVAVTVVSVHVSPLLARNVTCPSTGALGVALTVAVKVTGCPRRDGSGVSPVMLIEVATPVRCSTTRLLADCPTIS